MCVCLSRVIMRLTSGIKYILTHSQLLHRPTHCVDHSNINLIYKIEQVAEFMSLYIIFLHRFMLNWFSFHSYSSTKYQRFKFCIYIWRINARNLYIAVDCASAYGSCVHVTQMVKCKNIYDMVSYSPHYALKSHASGHAVSMFNLQLEIICHN